MKPFAPHRLPSGTTLQSGIPTRPAPSDLSTPNGLLARGAVTQTYVIGSDEHPATGNSALYGTAIYCDVLLYTAINGMRWQTLRKVPVAQDRGGLHGGHIWKPRAATMDITGATMDLQKGTNPGNLDGDHVLIGFLENALNQPIILGGIPHPAVDKGNDNFEIGKRFRLLEGDGDPDLHKHHGSYYGVDDQGNWISDTSFAHDGQLGSDGVEPDPPTDGKGSQARKAPKDATVEDQLLDMSSPAAPIIHALNKLEQNLYEVLLDGGKAAVDVQGGDGDATTVLGDGGVKAAIADHLETFYSGAGGIQPTLETWGGPTGHVRPTAWGPSGPPAPVLTMPAWAPAINSNKLKFPDG